MTKAERSRAASRRRRQAQLDFQTGIADSIGTAAGAFLAGSLGLAGRPLAGPLTVAGAVGLAGVAAKLMLPATDRVPALSGLTQGMITAGATELFLMGAARRQVAPGG